MRLVAIFAVTLPLWAGEEAVFASGSRMRIERHESHGGLVKLFTRHGVIEVTASEVVAFEVEEYTPPPPAAPIPVPAAKPAEPVAAPRRTVEPRELVQEAAARYGLPPEFLHSVARAESAYAATAISPKGAIGVMQLMPATAARLNADPHDPAQNVDAGARHLRDLLLRYDGSTQKALAAYNAGEGAVSRYGGVPPYAETRQYVERIIRTYQRLAASNSTGESAKP